MTVFEIARSDDRRRRRARVPARRAPRRRPRPARLRLPRGTARCSPSCSRTRTRITSARCRTCCARSGCKRGLGDAPDARPDQLEARRARAAALDRAARDRSRGRADRPRPVPRSSSCAWRTRCPTPSASRSRPPPAGVFHTGDWKLDHTPVDGLRTDVGKLAELGNRGVDLLLGDSTNAERPGFTRSERVVGEAFRQIIPQRTGRVLISSFASNIHRMQQAIDVAAEVGRKVAVIGRSMRKNLNIARNLELHATRPTTSSSGPVDLDDLAARAAADPLHGLAGRAALGADADRLQRPSRPCGSSAATR